MPNTADPMEQYDNLKRTVADRLRVLIEESKAASIAQAVGVDDAMLSKWKNGRNMPSLRSLCQLADHFQVSVDYLLGREDTEDDPFTTAGEIVDAIHRLERSTVVDMEVEEMDETEFALKYPDIPYVSGDPDRHTCQVLTLRVPHGAVVGYFDRERRIRQLFGADPVMRGDIDGLLKQYRDKAASVALNKNKTEGESP